MAMHSSSRNGAKVIWLAVHTTEGIMRAADLRAWTSWAGSSHAANDETGVLLSGAEDGFVDYDLMAWTLRNGNPISDNLEQCGWARWTRTEWLSRPLLLDTTAQWLAERHKARPWIPLVKLSPAEVAARKPGVLGHGDYSTGTGDGTHWDPGPNYPWDVVIDKARAYANGTDQEDDMTDAESQMLKDIKAEVMAARRQDYVVLSGQVARILAALQQGPGADIDEAALAAALAPSVIAALGEAKGITGADVEAAVRRVLADAAQA